MVRAIADRAFLPTKNLLEEVGDMMILTGKTVVSALRPPYPYGGEFVSQFLDRVGGGGGHGDHGGFGGAQDSRGARCVAGVGGRSGQEPGCAALFGVDVGDRAV